MPVTEAVLNHPYQSSVHISDVCDESGFQITSVSAGNGPLLDPFLSLVYFCPEEQTENRRWRLGDRIIEMKHGINTGEKYTSCRSCFPHFPPFCQNARLELLGVNLLSLLVDRMGESGGWDSVTTEKSPSGFSGDSTTAFNIVCAHADCSARVWIMQHGWWSRGERGKLTFILVICFHSWRKHG